MTIGSVERHAQFLSRLEEFAKVDEDVKEILEDFPFCPARKIEEKKEDFDRTGQTHYWSNPTWYTIYMGESKKQ